MNAKPDPSAASAVHQNAFNAQVHHPGTLAQQRRPACPENQRCQPNPTLQRTSRYVTVFMVTFGNLSKFKEAMR